MRTVPSQTDRTRRLFDEADRHLEQARTLVERGTDDHAALLDHSIRAMDRSLRAFLTWHSQPVDEDAALGPLARRAAAIESAFRTSAQLAPRLAELQPSIEGKDALGIDDREAVRRSYYVARNAHAVTRGALPAAVTGADVPAPS